VHNSGALQPVHELLKRPCIWGLGIYFRKNVTPNDKYNPEIKTFRANELNVYIF